MGLPGMSLRGFGLGEALGYSISGAHLLAERTRPSQVAPLGASCSSHQTWGLPVPGATWMPLAWPGGPSAGRSP